ncbi:hypothetical protein BGX26_008941, partial [Mortierella sp. AD094]
MVYRQIGELPKLRCLAINEEGLEVGDGSGISGLAPDRRSQLKEFMLLGESDPAWTKGRIRALLKMMPNLELLYIEHRLREAQCEMESWLEEMGRGDKYMDDSL